MLCRIGYSVMIAFKQSIVNIAEICAQKRVLNFIISAGSRSAPLTLAFVRHPQLTCRTIVDERSAAFIALGLAQQLGAPVGLVCTSGTAGLNYAPAVAEAYYQRIPLLILTADRPPEWIHENDNQTIHQLEMFGKHSRGSFDLPVDDTHPDAKWQIERTISEAINLSLWPIPGPVHINVPLREPLYPDSDLSYQKKCKVVTMTPPQSSLGDQIWDELIHTWKNSKKKLIVGGMHKVNTRLAEKLMKLHNDQNAAIVTDITANLQSVQTIHHSDMILGTESEEAQQDLAPDLLITFGGQVVSKNLKVFLRKYKPKEHWQIQQHGQCIDTFQSLTHILPVSAEYFFEKITEMLFSGKENTNNQISVNAKSYRSIWDTWEEKARDAMRTFMSDIPHSEFLAVNMVLKSLPLQGSLQLGNSFVIRLANFLSLKENRRIQVNSNRGTSGIDGTLSTAVGAALATTQITTIILGDLAFFYDRNALWHNYLPSNLRIIIINNYGGGIFRILNGASELPELREHFEVEHNLTAKNTAADHGLNYTFCDSKEALKKMLPDFFKFQDKPAILEIHTDKEVNAKTFFKFKSIMKELK